MGHAVEAAIGIDGSHVAQMTEAHLLRYGDARRGHARRVLVRDGVSLRGDRAAEGCL